MVVNPPGGNQRGVTLVELLMAVAMSTVVILLAYGLLKDVGFATRLLTGKRGTAFEAQAAFASMADNLMTGGGILALGPDKADVLNRRNRRVTYAWGDSALTVNGVAWKFRMSSLRLEASGPTRPDWKAFSGGMPWELDSLDSDRDGRLAFDELDRDRNGELDPEESRFIASIRITLIADHKGIPLVQTCLIHPRNRVPAIEGQEAEDILGSGGIPEP
jgi:prepilin-type N-terminal cleavage/methylation domain-containing protein